MVEEGVLLHLHVLEHNLLWFLGVLTAVYTACVTYDKEEERRLALSRGGEGVASVSGSHSIALTLFYLLLYNSGHDTTKYPSYLRITLTTSTHLFPLHHTHLVNISRALPSPGAGALCCA